MAACDPFPLGDLPSELFLSILDLSTRLERPIKRVDIFLADVTGDESDGPRGVDALPMVCRNFRAMTLNKVITTSTWNVNIDRLAQPFAGRKRLLRTWPSCNIKAKAQLIRSLQVRAPRWRNWWDLPRVVKHFPNLEKLVIDLTKFDVATPDDPLREVHIPTDSLIYKLLEFKGIRVGPGGLCCGWHPRDRSKKQGFGCYFAMAAEFEIVAMERCMQTKDWLYFRDRKAWGEEHGCL